MVEAIIKDEKRIFPCCVKLDGQYGLKDIFLGVPVKLGKNGVEEILELKLNHEEKELLKNSAEAVRTVIEVYNNMQL
jgi:malate dehydrogenase